MTSTSPFGARDSVSAIQRTADELVGLIDNFHPAGPMRRSDINSARNSVAAVVAALDRLDNPIRRESV